MAGCPCRSRSSCAVPSVVACDHAERQARSRGIIKQICVTRRLTKPVKLSGVQGSYAVVGRGSYSRADGPEHGRARSLPPGVSPIENESRVTLGHLMQPDNPDTKTRPRRLLIKPIQEQMPQHEPILAGI